MITSRMNPELPYGSRWPTTSAPDDVIPLIVIEKQASFTTVVMDGVYTVRLNGIPHRSPSSMRCTARFKMCVTHGRYIIVVLHIVIKSPWSRPNYCPPTCSHPQSRSYAPIPNYDQLDNINNTITNYEQHSIWWECVMKYAPDVMCKFNSHVKRNAN